MAPLPAPLCFPTGSEAKGRILEDPPGLVPGSNGSGAGGWGGRWLFPAPASAPARWLLWLVWLVEMDFSVILQCRALVTTSDT